MTRKDFEEIAKEMKALKPDDENSPAYHTWLESLCIIAKVCSIQNKRFDPEYFKEKCHGT